MNPWEPILDRFSDEGRRARDIVLAIAATPRSDPADRYEQALLCGYLAAADDDDGWRDEAIRLLNEAILSADELCATNRWGLFGGLAGLGWVVEHLAKMLIPGSGDLNAHTDAALTRELERGRWRGSCDLESGLAGIGVYFLDRPDGSAAFSLVLAHLEDRGELANAIHVLDRAIAARIEVERATKLLMRAADEAMASGARSEAALFFRIARRFNDERYREFAKRSADASSAHALNRIYQSENEPRYREMSREKFARMIDTWNGDPAIALPLLAAITSVPPLWDRRTLSAEER